MEFHFKYLLLFSDLTGELDFLINYDIKYRMGLDAEDETEEVDN